MSVKTILFDLDGTLLPMNQEEFARCYFGLLAKKLAPHGYDPKALIDGIWLGTKEMIKNDGSRSNEEVFWDSFVKTCGEKVISDKPIFEDFYESDFKSIKSSCGFNPEAAKTVEYIKNAGLRLALATNPIFPAVATRQRIEWAGLTPDMFEFFTSYENSHFCKPNPEYFAEVVKLMGVDPQECLMVGNDMNEDTPARTLGMKVFIVTDCIINGKEKLDDYVHGDFDDLRRYIDEII